jgi:hypothetical protein
MTRRIDKRKFKSITRRELLKLTPIVALGAFAIPKLPETWLTRRSSGASRPRKAGLWACTGTFFPLPT